MKKLAYLNKPMWLASSYAQVCFPSCWLQVPPSGALCPHCTAKELCKNKRGVLSALWVWEGSQEKQGLKCTGWDGRPPLAHRDLWASSVFPIVDSLTRDRFCIKIVKELLGLFPFCERHYTSCERGINAVCFQMSSAFKRVFIYSALVLKSVLFPDTSWLSHHAHIIKVNFTSKKSTVSPFWKMFCRS